MEPYWPEVDALHAVRFSAVRAAGAILRAALTGDPFESAVYAGDWASALRTAGGADLVVVTLARGWPLVARRLPPAPLVVDYIDALSASAAQAASEDPSPLRRAMWRVEAPRLRRLEAAVARAAALRLVTTSRDAAFLPAGTVVVPLGVELGPAPPPASSSAPVVAFTGRLRYRPNELAVRTLVDHVWPRVRRAVPHATLAIGGADAPSWIRALDGRHGIRVESPVASMPAFLRASRVVAVPVALGAGTPMKVFEALEAGRPVVGHPSVVARVDVPPGAPPLPIRTAGEPEEFATALAAWLLDGVSADSAGEGGRAWVAAHADRARIAEELAEHLRAAAAAAA